MTGMGGELVDTAGNFKSPSMSVSINALNKRKEKKGRSIGKGESRTRNRPPLPKKFLRGR